MGFDPEKDNWILWEDPEVEVLVPRKTIWPACFGGWVIVNQKQSSVKAPYDDYRLFAKMNVVAATVQKGLEETGLAPHANIQSNANWAFRKQDGSYWDLEQGRERRKVHIHIFGRMVEDPAWGNPIPLPTFRVYRSSKKYWGKVWSEEDMNRLITFLEYEVPKTLEIIKCQR